MSRRQRRGGMWLVLGPYLVLALVYSLALPLGEAPDEPGHYNYARIVASEQRLPTGEEEHEAFQPPLYYWLAAPLAGAGDTRLLPLKGNADFTLEPGGPGNLLVHGGDERFPYAGWAWGWRLVRLASVLFGAITVYAVYRLGELLSRGRRDVALMAAAAFALTPQFTLLHGAASNDTVTLALASLLLLQVCLVARGGLTTRRLALIGVLWGLAILGKASMLAAGAGIGVALLLARRRGRLLPAPGAVVRDSAVVGAGMALVSGWWFARNVLLHGDPLAWELVFDINQVRRGGIHWAEQVVGLYRSYWLDYVAMRLPEWLYVALLVPLAMAAAGLVLGVARRRALPAPPAVAAVLAVHILAYLAAWVRWTQAVEGTDQARLLYPALLALAAPAALGLSRWVPAARRHAAAPAVVAAMVALNVSGLVGGVLPVFAPPPRQPAAEAPERADTVSFAGRITLVDWRLPPSATAGDALELDLWWRAEAAIADDVWLVVRLVAADGSVPVWKQGTPSAGRDTTEAWPPGAVTYARHRLPLPPDLAPGAYTVDVGLRPFGADGWWPAAAAGAGPRDVWGLGEVLVD